MMRGGREISIVMLQKIQIVVETDIWSFCGKKLEVAIMSVMSVAFLLDSREFLRPNRYRRWTRRCSAIKLMEKHFATSVKIDMTTTMMTQAHIRHTFIFLDSS